MRQLTSTADVGPVGRRGRSRRVAWLSIGYLASPETSQVVRGLSSTARSIADAERSRPRSGATPLA